MKRLSDAVAIQSVSAWTEPKYRNEIVKMINKVKDVCMPYYSLYFFVSRLWGPFLGVRLIGKISSHVFLSDKKRWSLHP